MDNRADFTSVLRTFMERAMRTPMDLTRLTGLSPHTLRNWMEGKVRRPRLVNDVLKLARGLALGAQDTTSLLTAAGHPSLQILQVQAQQTFDPELTKLLASWPTAPTAEPGGTPARLHPPPILTPRHQLRPPIADFVGRDAEINQLVTILRTSVIEGQGAIISGVQGMGGIGKTELAFSVAHRLRDVFPDAQILLNLSGSTATPLTPTQALQVVIRTFAPDSKLPDNQDLLQQHYQTVLQGLRVLILLDDARDAAQVRPLLAPASCALLITSRTRFTLPGMTMVDLEELPAKAASTLLRTICPRLNEAEALALARACGFLPLALRVSGGLLRTTPALAFADYLRKLANAQQRLEQLRDPDDRQLDVAASLTLSYTQLDPVTQQLFRQLGVLVADFPTALALEVVEIDGEADVEALLHVLLRRNLVIYDQERGRWRLHDLVWALARRYLEAAGELEATTWRYAWAAVQLAQEVQDQYLAGGEGTMAALARFDSERAHINAARTWATAHIECAEGAALLVADAIANRHIGPLREDMWLERIPHLERALLAAESLRDQGSESVILNSLGSAYLYIGEPRRANPYYERRLALARERGDRRGEGETLGNLGYIYRILGDSWRAIYYSEQELALARAIGDQRAERLALTRLGYAYMMVGDVQRAIIYVEQAVTLARLLGDRLGEAVALGDLGLNYALSGDATLAIRYCEQACAIVRAIRDRRGEGYSLMFLARAAAALDLGLRATPLFKEALAIFREVHDRTGEADCNWHFGLALTQQTEREQALPFLRAAVTYQEEIGHAKAAEHAALLARLEAGEGLPANLLPAADQRAVGADIEILQNVDTQP